MLDARSKSHSLLFRSIALATAVTFFVTSLPIEKSWAVPAAIPGQALLGSQSRTKTLNPRAFNLPSYFGHINYAWTSSDPGLEEVVVHIQDAHCNYYAQHKISEIIEYLNKEYGARIVNLEGGKGNYNLSIFTDIEDSTIRNKVADYFVKEGIVNGAEYFAINNPKDIRLWGVEETDLYLENFKIYRDTLGHMGIIEKHLDSLSYMLSNLKLHIFSQELLEFDKKYGQYKADNLKLKEYISYLAKKSYEKAVNLKSFPNIYLLYQALKEEDAIDFKAANAERGALIDELQRVLSVEELEELVGNTVYFKKGQLSQNDFYAYLFKKAKSLKINIDKFPELKKYIVYISLYEAMDKLKIAEEMELAEKEIKEAIYANDKERELDRLSKNLYVMRNIFNVSLTKQDYNYYQKNKSYFETGRYLSFINREKYIYKIQAELSEDIKELDYYREEMARFYECSLKRDKAFLGNIRFTDAAVGKTGHGSRLAVLVTGGFHTENLCELFRKNNISYVSIIPNFKNENGYECPYFDLLAGKSNKILYTLVENASALALYGHFCENSGLIYGELDKMEPEACEKALRTWTRLVEAFLRKGGEESLVRTDNGFYIVLAPDQSPEDLNIKDAEIIEGAEYEGRKVAFVKRAATPSGIEKKKETVAKKERPRRRGWRRFAPRYSLRSLFILMTVTALLFSNTNIKMWVMSRLYEAMPETGFFLDMKRSLGDTIFETWKSNWKDDREFTVIDIKKPGEDQNTIEKIWLDRLERGEGWQGEDRDIFEAQRAFTGRVPVFISGKEVPSEKQKKEEAEKKEKEGAGSWFNTPGWIRNAWWVETGISFAAGAVVWGIL
ncbi:MAG: hypothetical protein JW994_01365, partial [Candidatus Omnitrophica bacterium]|nr:hypothetical protein [Candidatus Omnitrophota bacterium]